MGNVVGYIIKMGNVSGIDVFLAEDGENGGVTVIENRAKFFRTLGQTGAAKKDFENLQNTSTERWEVLPLVVGIDEEYPGQ
jgi:hypothetical protein